MFGRPLDGTIASRPPRPADCHASSGLARSRGHTADSPVISMWPPTSISSDWLARPQNWVDLANLCNEAALGAARHDRTDVTMEDFEQAWDKIVLGAVRPRVLGAVRTRVLTPHDRRVVAYHEGGHAVVAWLTPAADRYGKSQSSRMGRRSRPRNNGQLRSATTTTAPTCWRESM
jgi:AAA+ lid domain